MKVFDALSVSLLLSTAVLVMITTYVAFFNGWEILIRVNTIGEGIFEAVLAPLVVIVGVVTLVRTIKRANNG